MELKIVPSEILTKVKVISRSPHKFFADLKKEKGLEDSVSFLVFLALIGHILVLLALILIYPAIFSFSSDLISREDIALATLSEKFFFTASSFLFNIVVSFIGALIIFLILKIAKGKGSYKKAYRLYAYSRMPTLLFGWLPIASFLASIWGVYLLILGTKVMYQFSYKKSVIVYLLPFATLMLLLSYAINQGYIYI